jgi:hypothetical protein
VIPQIEDEALNRSFLFSNQFDSLFDQLAEKNPTPPDESTIMPEEPVTLAQVEFPPCMYEPSPLLRTSQ